MTYSYFNSLSKLALDYDASDEVIVVNDIDTSAEVSSTGREGHFTVELVCTGGDDLFVTPVVLGKNSDSKYRMYQIMAVRDALISMDKFGVMNLFHRGTPMSQWYYYHDMCRSFDFDTRLVLRAAASKMAPLVGNEAYFGNPSDHFVLTEPLSVRALSTKEGKHLVYNDHMVMLVNLGFDSAFAVTNSSSQTDKRRMYDAVSFYGPLGINAMPEFMRLSDQNHYTRLNLLIGSEFHSDGYFGVYETLERYNAYVSRVITYASADDGIRCNSDPKIAIGNFFRYGYCYLYLAKVKFWPLLYNKFGGGAENGSLVLTKEIAKFLLDVPSRMTTTISYLQEDNKIHIARCDYNFPGKLGGVIYKKSSRQFLIEYLASFPDDNDVSDYEILYDDKAMMTVVVGRDIYEFDQSGALLNKTNPNLFEGRSNHSLIDVARMRASFRETYLDRDSRSVGETDKHDVTDVAEMRSQFRIKFSL